MSLLEIWWRHQVPCDAFRAPVRDIREAKNMLSLLASYDQFQLDHNIKGDYCNAGGLEVFEDGEWIEWENPDGCNIDDVDHDGVSNE